MVNELLYAGADYDLTNYKGKILLLWAAEHGFIVIIKQLIAMGGNINYIDIYG
jgi:ankyrin repeat protein